MNIALVGLGPGAEFAPFGDPDWECWGLLWDSALRHYCDALFDMHEISEIKRHGGLEAAKDAVAPIYWPYTEATEGDARFLTYPLADVVGDIGHDWFESSAAYMVALAIHQKPSRIGLWGFHMTAEEEYAYQRPNLCWLLGMAEGRGIEVTVPDGCELMRYMAGSPGGHKYPARYGYRD